MALLTVSNPKTLKGEARGWLTAILHLAPYKLAGVGNVCPMATEGCAAACLNTAGRGGIFPEIQAARKRKTRAFYSDRASFMLELEREIAALERRAARIGLRPAVRLNGTSDIRFEGIAAGDAANLMELFPRVQFYDYTKLPNRRGIPANYHLTYSLAEGERSWKHHLAAIAAGVNVAVVLRDPSNPGRRALEFPPTWNGRPLVSGDASDLRFLDPVAPDGLGLYVGLRAKGRAIADTSGFVHDLERG